MFATRQIALCIWIEANVSIVLSVSFFSDTVDPSSFLIFHPFSTRQRYQLQCISTELVEGPSS
jgi:hypothetical protein